MRFSSQHSLRCATSSPATSISFTSRPRLPYFHFHLSSDVSEYHNSVPDSYYHTLSVKTAFALLSVSACSGNLDLLDFLAQQGLCTIIRALLHREWLSNPTYKTFLVLLACLFPTPGFVPQVVIKQSHVVKVQLFNVLGRIILVLSLQSHKQLKGRFTPSFVLSKQLLQLEYCWHPRVIKWCCEDFAALSLVLDIVV